jgi:hypothetical protein
MVIVWYNLKLHLSCVLVSVFGEGRRNMKSALYCYPYEKNEWEKPRNLLKKLCTSQIKPLSLFLVTFPSYSVPHLFCVCIFSLPWCDWSIIPMEDLVRNQRSWDEMINIFVISIVELHVQNENVLKTLVSNLQGKRLIDRPRLLKNFGVQFFTGYT